jgi:hypothetical protein
VGPLANKGYGLKENWGKEEAQNNTVHFSCVHFFVINLFPENQQTFGNFLSLFVENFFNRPPTPIRECAQHKANVATKL